MSNTTVTNLPVAIALNGNEEVQIVQANESKRTTVQDIANLTVNVGTVTQISTTAPITGGPITTSGTIALASQGVTNAYLALMPAYTLKGNATGASAVAQDLTATQALGLLGIGSIANNTLLGNVSGSTANPTANTLSSYIDSAISSTQGSLLYRNASSWVALAPDTVGKVLSTNGTGANPSWATIAGTGTVTSIATGTGLSGGPITTFGTISIANTAVTAGSYGAAATVPTYTVNAQGQLTAATDVAIAISASAVTSGVLAIARGGTGTGSTPTNGQLLIGNGTGYSVSALTQGTGLTITNGSGTVTLGITNTAVATGSYGSSSSVGTFTVNAQGQLTAAASVPINAIALTTGTISTGPTSDTDIANKLYVDSVAQGLNVKAAAVWGTTANITLSGLGTQAGGEWTASLTVGDRILVKNQSTQANNGIYSAASGTWTRTTDANIWDELVSAFIFVQKGATLGDTGWVCTVDSGGTLGVTAVTWAQFSGAGTYLAGTGLTLTGNTFSITNTAVAVNSYGSSTAIPTFTVNAQGQLTAASTTAVIAPAGTLSGTTINSTVVTSSLTSVGTIGTGVWNGTAIGATYGGTGQTTYAVGDLLYASSTTALSKLGMGTTGQVLVATTSGSPSWGAIPSTAAVTTISFGTTGLTPSAATSGAVTVAGTLVAANGGTGQSSYTVGDILYASTTTALSKLADVAVGSVLVSGGVGVAPAYSATPTVTSLTAPTVYGGTGVGSSLTLQSTSGVGATDSIVMKVGNAGATTALSVASSGVVSFPTTGAIVVPVGTTAQEPTGVTGMLRFNSTTVGFEGYNGSVWASVGGGATGGSTDQIFYLNGQTVTTSYSIPSGQNAGTFGPVSVNSGATVTIPSGSTWSIV